MKLLALYTQLVGLVLLGFILGDKLPKRAPTYLGQFLFWIGVPISIMAFLRQTELSGAIWIAPLFAWLAILLGAGLAWAWINLGGGAREQGSKQGGRVSRLEQTGVEQGEQGEIPVTSYQLPITNYQLPTTNYQLPIQNPLSKIQNSPSPSFWSQPTQGSFLLAAMVGNTGYIGYPVTLAVLGTKYFGWALFYDLLGTTLGAYGLGVVLGARFSKDVKSNWQLAQAILINPALWSFGLGLVFRQLPLPNLLELSLQRLGWAIVFLSLVLIGIRLRQLNSWHSLPKASISLGIKMLLVPLILGSILPIFGIRGAPQLVIVLQMAMPPAFATLVIAEAYNLDRNLAVTAIAVGSMGLLLTLPIWLTLF